jgi:Big-like domain-containing protein/flagellar hook capping protein FlgD
MVFATRRSLIVAVLATLWPVLGRAAPKITGVWGSGANGATIQITGTGFGTHGAPSLQAVPDAYVVAGDTLRVSAPGVLANDRDSNGYPLTAQLGSGPSHGLVQLYLDGSFRYVPQLAFWGADTFTYIASNGHGATAAARVTLAVRKQAGVVFEEAQSGGSSAARTVATAGVVGTSPGDLHLVAIATKPYRAATAVAGLGARWTFVRAQCSGRGQTGVEIWMGRGATSAASVTASFATAPMNAVIVACRYSGVDIDHPVSQIVSGNTNGLRGTCEGGVDGAGYDFGLAPKASGSRVFGAVTMRNRTQAPGFGYTKRAEARAGSGGDQASVQVVDRAAQGTVSIDGTLSGVTDWAMAAVEIRPAGETPRRGGPAGPRTPRTAAVEPTTPLPELRVFPNPARDGAEISFEVGAGAAVRVEIHDAAGRRIRTLLHGGQPSGLVQVVWDGRDDAGHPVPSGVYFLRFEVDSRRLSRKLVVQR